RNAVSKELCRLQAEGIIERGDASPWVSPIVVTTKKNGEIRLCVDLREPNRAVIIDSHPLPHMEDLFTELNGATMFSSIDLNNAYLQVMLHEDSRDLTAFITHDRLFRFRRVPYGLASAPAAFQKMMVTILKGLHGVQNYLDDVIVYGRTATEHDRNLQAVLTTLQHAGLTLNRAKCKFSCTSLTYLGHTITAQGLLPSSHGRTQIAFILRTYVLVLTVRAELRFGGGAYEGMLKEWAVLTQIHADSSERTVAFASRSLSIAERKYSIVEKEALACVWAVERWRTFLWGRRFTLRTDHQALTTLLATKGMGRAGMRIARWSARLLCFNYEVSYKPGSENVTADCLSRLPLPTCVDTDSAIEPDMVAFLSAEPRAFSLEEFSKECAACPELSALRQQLLTGWPKNKKTLSPELAPYFHIRDELAAQDSLVFRGPYRLVAPVSLLGALIKLAHQGHQGIVRTKQRLRDLYWWPGMDHATQSAITSCQLCQAHDKSAKIHTPPLQPVPLPAAPWLKVGFDIVGPFELGTWDCRYALTLVHYYSKWPEIAFTSNVTADTVTDFLATTFSWFGNPVEIVTDTGVQFTSLTFAEFLTSRNIKHVRTSLYFPQANGAVECMNHVLKDCVQTASLEGKPWKTSVRDFLLHYRTTLHATTGVAPSELLLGRQLRTNLNILPTRLAACTDATVRARVHARQSQVKTYTDIKCAAKPSVLRP
ncbi:hypothetical protein M9458_032563, partial [Cirrhinus mrigala]